MAVIFGAIAIILLLITFAGTQERTNLEKNTASEAKEKVSVGESFKLLFKNKYFWLLTVVFCCKLYNSCVNNGTSYLLCERRTWKCRTYGNSYFMLYSPKTDRKPGLSIYQQNAWKMEKHDGWILH